MLYYAELLKNRWSIIKISPIIIYKPINII